MTRMITPDGQENLANQDNPTPAPQAEHTPRPRETPPHAQPGGAQPGDLRRYRENSLSEQEGVALYHLLADTERDPHLSDLYRQLAVVEQRHQAFWDSQLQAAGAEPPRYRPTWRMRTLSALAHRWGAGLIAPIVGGMESRAQTIYDD